MKNRNFTKDELMCCDSEVFADCVIFYGAGDSEELVIFFTAVIEGGISEDRHGFKGLMTDYYDDRAAFVNEKEPITAELDGQPYDLNEAERAVIIEIINGGIMDVIFSN